MKRVFAILLLVALLLCGCGKKEEEQAAAAAETTVTGMVVSVDGTKVSLISMESGSMPSRGENGQRPTLPEGETMPEGGFNGQRPEGEMPALPEGETMPEGGFDGQFPKKPEGERPTMPEGETRPERENGSFGDMETTEIDLAGAHITVEFDGGKATGSMEDITPGSFLTITMVDGKATKAVVSQNSFGGMQNFGGGGDRGERPVRDQQSGEQD